MRPHRPILTAARMLAAEQQAIDAGVSLEALMERAGAALAEAAYRVSGGMPALILCGPGNNGGDGYVAARHLAARGVQVRVARLGDPMSEGAIWARGQWNGAVEPLTSATQPAPLVIDCLFGTGLKRGLDAGTAEAFAAARLGCRCLVACDLPSGVDADTGEVLSSIGDYHLTLAMGALKPAHRLAPAMHHMGRVAVADIGVDTASDWMEISPPRATTAPHLSAHKYSRGLVHALAGKMPGAIALAATAAARTGAGYVRLSTAQPIPGLPSAIVQTDTAVLSDPRIGCILVGPGMGDIPQLLTLALTSSAQKVIDGDAITHLGEPARLMGQDAILTPHEGEFVRLFGDLPGSKAERALEAAKRSGAVVVYKGPDTLVATPEGLVGFAPPAPAWLATAGTGDVLAGMIAALRAQGLSRWDAACAGVWLHGRAAEQAGPYMIADDLLGAIPKALERL